jgi:tetratricopeptide (TPR) repeat protein
MLLTSILPTLLVATRPAYGDVVQKARQHFALGRQHVQNHEYDDAIREFEAGYQLKPAPPFLYNIGLVARLSGKREQALDAFERYLQAAPSATDRPEVERDIAELKQQLAADKPASAPPPASRPDLTSPSAVAAAVPAPAPTSAPKKSHRTLWIVLGSVGGALIVGGVVTGIVLGTRGGDIPGGYRDVGSLNLGL